MDLEFAHGAACTPCGSCQVGQCISGNGHIGKVPGFCILHNEYCSAEVFRDKYIGNIDLVFVSVGSDKCRIVVPEYHIADIDHIVIIVVGIDQRIGVAVSGFEVFKYTAVEGQLCIVHIGDRLGLIAAAERCRSFPVCRSVNTAAAEGDIIHGQFCAAGQTEDLGCRAVSADLKHDIAVGSVNGHGLAVEGKCHSSAGGDAEFDLCILHIFSEGDGITFQ